MEKAVSLWPGAGGGGNWECLLNRYEVSFWGDEKALKLR